MAPLGMVSVVSPEDSRSARGQLPLLDSDEDVSPTEACRPDARDKRGGDAKSGHAGASNQGEEPEGNGWCPVGIHLPPKVLLFVFIYANLLNYIDRGLVMGSLPEFW